MRPASPAEPLRLGLASTGWIADLAVHQPIAEGVAARVVFVASRDRERAGRYAAAHRIPAYGTWSELLANRDIDAVYLATPNADHVARAGEAVRAGKHVLVEKPLGCDAAAVRDLMAEAASRDVLVHEAFHYAEHPAVAGVLAALAAGAAGTVQRVDVEYGWFLDRLDDIRLRPELDGGAFADVGCYGVDLLHRLVSTGWRLRGVTAERGPTGVDLVSEAQLEAGGTEAVVRASLRSRNPGCRVSVFGSSAHAHLVSPFLPVPPPGAGLPHFEVRWETGKDSLTLPRSEKSEPLDRRSSYHHQLANFARRVASHAPPASDRATADRATVLEQVHLRMKGIR